MKRLMMLSICVLYIFSFLACSEVKFSSAKARVIFDTDMGNDVDDIMALQMLINYQKQSNIELIGITVSKSNPYSMLYVDGYCKFNNLRNIPLGYMYEGPNKEDGNYLKQTLDTIIDGKKILPTKLKLTDKFIEAYKLQRKLLSTQPDNSVILIAVGPQTNLQRLLESSPDEFSELTGSELIKSKVNKLVVMGGNFDVPEKRFAEWNIVQDIKAAQIVFSKWPTEIIVSGFEIGHQLLFPGKIINSIHNAYKHPMSVSYNLFQKMPYDRESWDLTAVLYAIRPNNTQFGISVAGRITVLDDGKSEFNQVEDGNHFYLKLSQTQIPFVLKSLISDVTNKK